MKIVKMRQNKSKGIWQFFFRIGDDDDDNDGNDDGNDALCRMI